MTLKTLKINHAANFLLGQYERLRKIEFYGALGVIQIVNQSICSLAYVYTPMNGEWKQPADVG